MLELELDPEAGRPRADSNLVAECRGEGVLGRPESVLEVGVDDDRSWFSPAARPFCQLARAALGFPDRPALGSCVAGEAQTLRLILCNQERATMATGQLAGL